MKRLAVVFPGIGYTADRSLLYYSRRIAERFGYESLVLPYKGFPKKVKGDRSKLKKSCEIALEQAEEMLSAIDLSAHEEILFIGKSIGTVAAASIAAQSKACGRMRLVLYTPLEETFVYPIRDAVVFTGTADPWVGGENNRIPVLCGQQKIKCFVIHNANHSLETQDPRTDVLNLQMIMEETEAFIREEQLRRIAYHETLLQELKSALSEPGIIKSEERTFLREKADRLSRYYGSNDWKLDFADDESGRLPEELKRGVLSEDGIYNVLEAFHDLYEE